MNPSHNSYPQPNPDEQLHGRETIARATDIARLALLNLGEWNTDRKIEAIPQIVERADEAIDNQGTRLESIDHELAFYNYIGDIALNGTSSVQERNGVEEKNQTPRARSRSERRAEDEALKLNLNRGVADATRSWVLKSYSPSGNETESRTYRRFTGRQIEGSQASVKQRYKSGEMHDELDNKKTSMREQARLVEQEAITTSDFLKKHHLTERAAKLRKQADTLSIVDMRYTESLNARVNPVKKANPEQARTHRVVDRQEKRIKKTLGTEDVEKTLEKRQLRTIGKIQTRHAKKVAAINSEDDLLDKRNDYQDRIEEVQDRRQERKNAPKIPVFNRTKRASKAIVRGVSSVTIKALNKQAVYRQARRNRRSS